MWHHTHPCCPVKFTCPVRDAVVVFQCFIFLFSYMDSYLLTPFMWVLWGPSCGCVSPGKIYIYFCLRYWSHTTTLNGILPVVSGPAGECDSMCSVLPWLCDFILWRTTVKSDSVVLTGPQYLKPGKVVPCLLLDLFSSLGSRAWWSYDFSELKKICHLSFNSKYLSQTIRVYSFGKSVTAFIYGDTWDILYVFHCRKDCSQLNIFLLHVPPPSLWACTW